MPACEQQAVDEEAASDGIAAYGEALVTRYTDNTRRKMGLKVEDGELANKLLMLMYESSADYTNTFRTLGGISLADMELAVEVKEVPSRLRKWFGDGFEEEKDDNLLEDSLEAHHEALALVARMKNE